MALMNRPRFWLSALFLFAGCNNAPPSAATASTIAPEEDTPAAAAAEPDEPTAAITASELGREISVVHHLNDGDEFTLSTKKLLAQGQKLFTSVWTIQEGGGRPLTKGTGAPLTDPTSPLLFPRNFNRLSAPDSNACSSCHNTPLPGGGGHFVANAFIPGQRFDFMTFDHGDSTSIRGAADERGIFSTLQQITNSRATLGMFGSGFVEMLARQMTQNLQAIRDGIAPGGSAALTTKGVDFGTLARRADGSWDTSKVEGLPTQALLTSGPSDPPSLVIRPFHQAGTVVSIREFTNNAFNHHHGIQSEERFGKGVDADGDGFVDEITRADITATALFQATLAVPGRVIPNNPVVENAVANGEKKFSDAGCASCHRPTMPLDNKAWIYSEPNPFNPTGNLRPGDAPPVEVDLTSNSLPGPRLKHHGGRVDVPVFTDFKLHDITTGPDDPNADPIDMNHGPMSPEFFAGARKFLTKKLWGAANEPPFFHHGKFVTMRQAILAHAGEAQSSTAAFRALAKYDQDSIIEFLKTLQVLPQGARSLIVDEHGNPKSWSPAQY